MAILLLLAFSLLFSTASAQTSITDSFAPVADAVILNRGEGTPEDREYRNASLGGDVVLPVGNLMPHGGNQTDALMHFDLAQIPFGSTIVSATLDLYQIEFNAGGPPTATIAIWVIALPWTEGQVHYNNFIEWDPVGGGFEQRSYFALPPVPSLTLDTSDDETVVSFNVTNIVSSWIDETYVNRGFFIWSSSESEVVFGSRENATVAQRPELTVVYLPGGALGTSSHPLAIHIRNLGLPDLATLAAIGLLNLLIPLGAVTALHGFPTNQELLPVLLVGLSANVFLRFWPPVLIVFIGLLCGWMLADLIPRRDGG